MNIQFITNITKYAIKLHLRFSITCLIHYMLRHSIVYRAPTRCYKPEELPDCEALVNLAVIRAVTSKSVNHPALLCSRTFFVFFSIMSHLRLGQRAITSFKRGCDCSRSERLYIGSAIKSIKPSTKMPDSMYPLFVLYLCYFFTSFPLLLS